MITFEENRNDVFLIHDLKDPEKRLYVTKNFGETYDVVQHYVRNFFFHYTKTETKLYVERIQPQRDDANAKDEVKVSVYIPSIFSLQIRNFVTELDQLKDSFETCSNITN